MKKIETIENFKAVSIKSENDLNDAILNFEVPVEALQDIKSRIADHLMSVGEHEDPYIMQQYRYIENLININPRKKVKPCK